LGERSEIRADLNRNWDLDRRCYRGNDPKIFSSLDLDGVFVRIAGHRVNVQFQTVDAGLLDLPGEFNPVNCWRERLLA